MDEISTTRKSNRLMRRAHSTWNKLINPISRDRSHVLAILERSTPETKTHSNPQNLPDPSNASIIRVLGKIREDPSSFVCFLTPSVELREYRLALKGSSFFILVFHRHNEFNMKRARLKKDKDWGIQLRIETLEYGMKFGDIFTGEFTSGTGKAEITGETRDKLEERCKIAESDPPTSPTLRPRKRCPEKQRANMTELYQRNQIINNTMAGRPSLAHPAIPQHLLDQRQSTDSNDSVDSVATQIPGVLYQDTYQRQDNAFMMGQTYRTKGPAATQGMYNNSFSMQGPRSSLNPVSTPFAPSIYGDVSSNGFTSQNNSGQSANSGYASYYPQNPDVTMNFNPYGTRPYAEGNIAPGPLAPPSFGPQPTQFQHPQTQDPYTGGTFTDGIYNAIPANRGEHQTYGDSQQFGASSPTLSYASGPSGPPSSYGAQGFAYQNMTYPPSSQYGAQSFNPGNNTMSQGYGNTYNSSYGNQRPNHGYSQSANENRGRLASGGSFGNYPSGMNTHASFQTRGQIQNIHYQNNKVDLQQALCGEVHLPSQSTTHDPSPEKNTNLSTRESFAETHTHLENQLVNGETASFTNQQGQGTEKAALIRSTRGKTITSSTTPSREATIAWVGSVPQMSPEASANRNLRSPPKMKNLIASGGIGSRSVAPIIGNDPFAVQPHPQRAQPYNPFVTSNQISGPYNGNAQAQAPKMSQALCALTKNGKPTFEEATNNLPFVEYCRLAETNNFGVIRIKNIPYSVERSEVFAFLGRNARVINETSYEPVHIVMERVTSKTLDCFVEFVNLNEAVNAVNRFETNRDGGRGGRLGPRHVEVELSSQEALMKELFPKTKNVYWKGVHPTIMPRDPLDRYNSGFQGFVTKEELVMLLKHVEAPQRSPFSKDCPERPYECIISTLLKYPWQMVDYITIEDRELLHHTTLTLLQKLQERVDNYDDRKLNPVLLKRVWRAALKCPGFSPAQKDDFVVVAGLSQEMALEFGLPEYAACWKTLWTIGPKVGYPSDLVNYYAALIREYTDPKKELSLAERAALGAQTNHEDHIFGNLAQFTAYPPRSQLMNMTLAQVALIEWEGIEKVLRQCLTRQLQQ